MKQQKKRAVVNLTVRVTVDVPMHIYERDTAGYKNDCAVLGDKYKEKDVWSDWAGEAVMRGLKLRVGPNEGRDWSELCAEVVESEIIEEPHDI